VFRREVLANGLRVLGEPNAEADTVALGFFVRTGARDERPHELGASHFIEHLLFKGSVQVTGRDLNAGFDLLGGNVNAFTSEETTVYHAACLPEHAPELLRLLAHLLQPAFRPEDVEVERGVILEEIAMYADQPAARAFDELRARVWGEHPLGHRVLGTPETVAALTPGVLRDNFRARYGTATTTLVACGRFDWEALVRQAEELTRSWPRGGFTRARPEHAFRAGFDVITDPELTRVQFALAAPGVAATDPRREAAVVLADILGGDNGRLYWALVDTGLADGADLSHVEFDETGAYEGDWTCDPERAEETLHAVRNVLATVQNDGVTEAEVARSRRKLAVGAALRAETPYARLFSLGMDDAYLGQPVSVEETVQRFEAVTRDDVLDLLRAAPFDRAYLLALGGVDTHLAPVEAESGPSA